MSYCRWSNDGFQCDVYAYEGQRGFTTHVANSRHPKRVVDIDFTSEETLKASIKLRDSQLSAPDNKPIPIGLQYDGENFYDGDKEEFLATLLHLRDVGYLVPDDVIECVRQEIEDERNEVE